MWPATAFTVQVVPSGRSAVGSSVIEEPGEPLTVKLFALPVGHSSVNELPLAVTLSLKLTTTVVLVATWVAASAGDVLVTVGAASEGVKLKTEFAARLSGGSPVSMSLTWLAITVTLQ